MWVELLKTLGLIAGAGILLVILPIVLISFLSSSHARKQASTRLEAAQPQNPYHSDALAAEYRGVKLLCCTREGDVDGLVQVVDTSIYEEKNIIGLTLISPKNLDNQANKEEIKAMTLRELPVELRAMVNDDILNEMIEDVLHRESYCIINNADVIQTEDGTWLIKMNGQLFG